MNSWIQTRLPPPLDQVTIHSCTRFQRESGSAAAWLAGLVTRASRPRIRGMGWAQSTASVFLFMIITGTVSSNVAAAQALPPLTVASISAAATVDREVTPAAATNPEMATSSAGVTVLTGRC